MHTISLILKELLLLNSMIVSVSYVLLDNVALVTFLVLSPYDDYKYFYSKMLLYTLVDSMCIVNN